jgi:hypothetical protein
VVSVPLEARGERQRGADHLHQLHLRAETAGG